MTIGIISSGGGPTEERIQENLHELQSFDAEVKAISALFSRKDSAVGNLGNISRGFSRSASHENDYNSDEMDEIHAGLIDIEAGKFRKRVEGLSGNNNV